MVARVHYQIWDNGDLCESCHARLESANMSCDITEGNVTDTLYSEDLKHLWEIKLMTGKSIIRQLSEAVGNYAERHLLALDRNLKKMADPDCWRELRGGTNGDV